MLVLKDGQDEGQHRFLPLGSGSVLCKLNYSVEHYVESSRWQDVALGNPSVEFEDCAVESGLACDELLFFPKGPREFGCSWALCRIG
jgi:hypothetical protein